uniref:transmembrane protein 258-like n=1 Tax=Myodes glareolus TaxID=447135 RepID=UPI002020B94F|nr:transmembrane protein 258-like [Myodes glareolus]
MTVISHTSPIKQAVFPHLVVVLLVNSMFFTSWFFIYKVFSTNYTHYIYKEHFIFLVASFFVAFEVLFLLIWGGICI